MNKTYYMIQDTGCTMQVWEILNPNFQILNKFKIQMTTKIQNYNLIK